MKIKLRSLLMELCLWLLAETVLGSLGLDDLADYGEYLKLESGIVLLKRT